MVRPMSQAFDASGENLTLGTPRQLVTSHYASILRRVRLLRNERVRGLNEI